MTTAELVRVGEIGEKMPVSGAGGINGINGPVETASWSTTADVGAVAIVEGEVVAGCRSDDGFCAATVRLGRFFFDELSLGEDESAAGTVFCGNRTPERGPSSGSVSVCDVCGQDRGGGERPLVVWLGPD